MNKNFTKYTKKNVLLIASVAAFGFVLCLLSAGSDSNNTIQIGQTSDANQAQNNQANQNLSFWLKDTGTAGSSSFSGTELFYKTMLAVVLVAALGTAAIFMTKKFLPKIANFQGREIRVIETVHLGPRKSVHLLEIGSRRLLIGSTNENIRKLADLTEFTTDLSIRENELD